MVSSPLPESTIPQILDLLQSGNYAETLLLTSKILQNGCDDQQQDSDPPPLSESLKIILQQVHCRTLIALKRFTHVVDYYNDTSHDDDVTNNDFLFLEYVYSLYKLGRYVQCRDLILTKINHGTSTNKYQNGSHNDGGIISMEGMIHILAQCQYRLHETNNAWATYTELYEKWDSAGNQDEILTNALAVKVSNHATIASPIDANDVMTAEVVQKMQDIELGNDNHDNDDDGYLYELVYNAATNLLLQSTSLVQTKKALELLQCAEQKCLQEFENSNDSEKEEEEEKESSSETDNENKQKIKCKSLMPIQANIALAKMQLGDINGSTRSYLELVLATKKVIGTDPMFDGGGAMLAVDNNLVVLNSKRGSSSSSIFDLLKRFPNLDSGGDGATMGPSPSQVRIILHNRALLYHKMKKFTECKSVLGYLRKSISDSVSHDSVPQSGGGASKKKRKKGKNEMSLLGSSGGHHYAAPLTTAAETILWESRIELLENECTPTKDDDSNAQIEKITLIEEKIKSALQKAPKNWNEISLLEYALAEIMLFKSQKVLGITSNNPVIEEDVQLSVASTLEELPQSLRQRPAVIATLYSLYSNLGLNDKLEQILESMELKGKKEDNLVETKRFADFKLRLGLYQEAATIYKSILNEIENGDDSFNAENEMECIAGLVKALSFFDIEGAIEYSGQLSFDSDEFDGGELEAKEIPRLSKGASESKKMRKILGSHRQGKEK